MSALFLDQRSQCKEALENPKKFWEKAAEKLVWTKKWTSVLDDSEKSHAKWFPGGEINLCYNCVDRHVKDGHGHAVAFIGDSAVTSTRTSYTFSQVLDQVSRLAGVLQSLGVKKKDLVMIYLPMIPEGVLAQFACARIGAIHAYVPSGMPAKDLAARINLSKPKILIMGSHGYHASGWMDYKKEVDEAYDLCNEKPEKVIVFQREHMDPVPLVSGRDIDWKTEVSKATPVDSVPVEATEPSFVVYTSGSTGQPKAIAHSGGSFAVRWANNASIFFPRGEDEVFYGATNFGWIAGVLISYGAALARTTSVIFEGDPLLSKDVRALYRILHQNQVTRTFIRPGLLKGLRGMDPDGKVASEFNLDSLEHVYFGGERVDPSTMDWVLTTLKASVWNIYAQTEIACTIAGSSDNSVRKDCVVAQQQLAPLPGFDVRILTADGKEAGVNEPGRITLRCPLPPGALVGVYKNEEAFQAYFSEFPGHFDTKDEGCLDENGFLRVHNRADDLMKAGFGYIAAPTIEEVVMENDSVRECVVVSFTDLVWKEIPVTLYVKKTNSVKSKEQIQEEIHKRFSERFDPTIKFGSCVQVKELPVTRTGKVHRPSCRAMVRGKEFKETGAVENPRVLPDILLELQAYGYGKDVLLE